MIEQNVAILKKSTKRTPKNNKELELIDMWNNLGRVYDIISNDEKGFSCCNEALRISQLIFGNFHGVIAKT